MRATHLWLSGRVVMQRPAKPCTSVRFRAQPPKTKQLLLSAARRFFLACGSVSPRPGTPTKISHANCPIAPPRRSQKKLLMKWDKTAVLAVIAIFSISYLYSSIRQWQLSNKVEAEKLRACEARGGNDCGLIPKYHDDCFESSYRAEFRIRTFRYDEYNRCIATRIKQHRG